MDLSNFNMSTVIMLVLAIAIAYTAIKIISNIVYRVISLVIGFFLLVFVLTQLGISIPMLSDISNFFFSSVKVALDNLQTFLQQLK